MSGPLRAPRSQRNALRFLVNWARAPLSVGAVFPSSRALARRMASCVPASALCAGTAVVELGPGTGVVTAALIERGIDPASLILVEYSPDFTQLLRKRFPGVTILQGDAFEPGEAFREALGARSIGAVVSSLPLMARPETLRVRALDHHLSQMAAGAPFVQFTYSPREPVAAASVGAVLESTPWVLGNLPPARVLVYRRPHSGGTARKT